MSASAVCGHAAHRGYRRDVPRGNVCSAENSALFDHLVDLCEQDRRKQYPQRPQPVVPTLRLVSGLERPSARASPAPAPGARRPDHTIATLTRRTTGSACKSRLPSVIVIGGQSAPAAKRIEKWPAAGLVWRAPASIHAEDRTVLPAKQDIDADLEDALGLLDIDWKPERVSEAGYWSADEVI